MDSDQKVNLKWGEFQNNITASFSQLRKTDNFCDVTLVAEDGQKIMAHRVILSASSPLFEQILIQNNLPKPLIYMRGTKSSYLNWLVDFIYQGEVDINHGDLKDFLEIAAELKIIGLTKEVSQNESQELSTMKLENIHHGNDIRRQEELNLPQIMQHFKGRVQFKSKTHLVDNIVSNELEKSSGKPDVLPKEEVLNELCENEINLGNYEDKNATMQMKSNIGSSYSCDICGKSSITKKGIFKHKSRYHNSKEPPAYECLLCGKKSISRAGLYQHNVRHHTNI